MRCAQVLKLNIFFVDTKINLELIMRGDGSNKYMFVDKYLQGDLFEDLYNCFFNTEYYDDRVFIAV